MLSAWTWGEATGRPPKPFAFWLAGSMLLHALVLTAARPGFLERSEEPHPLAMRLAAILRPEMPIALPPTRHPATASRAQRQTTPAAPIPAPKPIQVAAAQAAAAPAIPAAAAIPAAPAAAASGAIDAPPQAHAAEAPAPVTAARVDPQYKDNPKPDYPALSRRLGEEGRVLLRVAVNADGSAATVNVSRSSGFPRLDQSAQRAVQHWRFVPARRGDEAIPGSVTVPILFRLDDA